MFDWFKSTPKKEAQKALRSGDYRTAGDLFKLLGDYESALHAYVKGRLYQEAAYLCEEIHDWEKAAKYWERARMFREAGETYMKAGHKNKARQMFELAKEYGRAKELAVELKQWLHAGEYAAKIHQYVEAGQYFFKGQAWDRAFNISELGLKRLEKDRAERGHLPEWRREYIILSKIAAASAYRMGQFEKAGDFFLKAEEYGKAVDCYLKAAVYDKALRACIQSEDYERGLEILERHPSAQSNLELAATIYFNTGEYRRAAGLFMAIKEYEMAARSFEYLKHYNDAAKLYELAGDYERATELYIKAENWIKAAELFESIGSLAQAGTYFLQAGDKERAAQVFMKAQMYFEAGKVYLELGNYKDAIMCLQRVEEISLDYESASIMLAEALLKMKNPDVALERLNLLTEKISHTRNEPHVLYLKARAYEMKENYEMALKIYKSVLSIDVLYKDTSERIQKVQAKLEAQKLQKSDQQNILYGRYEVLHTQNINDSIQFIRAIDKTTNEPVLIKRIHTKERIDVSPTLRVQTLSHKLLASLTETIHEGNDVFLCMEYHDGMTLREWFNKPRSVNDAIDLGIQIAEALSYCHQQNLVFGFIPPESVYITRDYIVKLLPWESLLGLKIPNLHRYASPEYIQGKRLTPASDAFCFGVLLYEIIFRQLPPSPLKFPDNIPVPPELNSLLKACLHPDPTKRPQSMNQLIEVLGSADIFEGMVIDGRYMVEKELGRGGMGRVYLVKDLVLQEMIALKLLHGDILSNPHAFQRLIKEIKIARKITHPNVVRVYEIGSFRGARYLTMEYVHGIPLNHLIETQGPLPLKRWFGIVYQIVSGLKAAHDIGVIHRDLKPQNIMLTRENVIKILDFGIARSLDVPETMNTTDTIVGSPKYMAPEQILGKKLDVRSDLYSLGIVFYYMLTGEEPFTGPSVKSVLMKQLNEQPPPIRNIRKDIPEEIERFIMKLLEKKPERRFNNCTEVLEALHALRNKFIQKS